MSGSSSNNSPDDEAKLVSERMTQFLSPLLQDAFSRGHKRGVEATIKAFRTALEEIAKTPPTINTADLQIKVEATLDKSEDAAAHPTPDAAQKTFQRGEVPEQVLALVTDTPGLTGAQLVQVARQRGTPIHERSLRTALRRLRLAGKIVNSAGAWFVAGHPRILPETVDLDFGLGERNKDDT